MSDPTVIDRECVQCHRMRPHTAFNRTATFTKIKEKRYFVRTLADVCRDCGGPRSRA